MTAITEITADQFDAANPQRHPSASAFVQEREFYSALDGWYVGAITQDRHDKDFGYVVLGPDQNDSQRAIKFKAGITTQDEARNLLLEQMELLAAGGKQVHPQ